MLCLSYTIVMDNNVSNDTMKAHGSKRWTSRELSDKSAALLGFTEFCNDCACSLSMSFTAGSCWKKLYKATGHTVRDELVDIMEHLAPEETGICPRSWWRPTHRAKRVRNGTQTHCWTSQPQKSWDHDSVVFTTGCCCLQGSTYYYLAGLRH